MALSFLGFSLIWDYQFWKERTNSFYKGLVPALRKMAVKPCLFCEIGWIISIFWRLKVKLVGCTHFVSVCSSLPSIWPMTKLKRCWAMSWLGNMVAVWISEFSKSKLLWYAGIFEKLAREFGNQIPVISHTFCQSIYFCVETKKPNLTWQDNHWVTRSDTLNVEVPNES